MDTSFDHVSNVSLQIDKAVTVTSYRTAPKVPARAVLRFQNLYSFYRDGDQIFRISSKNVSFSSIDIIYVENSYPVFRLVDPCQRITVQSCNIKMPEAYDGPIKIFDLRSNNLTDISVADTNFLGQKRQTKTNIFPGRFSKNALNMEKKIPEPTIPEPTIPEPTIPEPTIPKEPTTPITRRTIVTFDRCSFVNSDFSWAYGEQTKLFVNNSAVINSEIEVPNMYKSYFTNNTFTVSSLTITIGDSTSIKDCRFRGTSLFVTRFTSFSFQLDVRDLQSTRIKNCTFEKAIYGALNLHNSKATLRETKFIDNTIFLRVMMSADRAAGITSYSGSLNILECRFINNSAPTNQPGAIYSRNTGCSRPCITFTIDNTTIISGRYQSSSDDSTVIVTEPIDYIGTEWSEIGDGTEIQCQPNEFMYQHVHMLNYFKFHCKQCAGTRYNAKHAGCKGYVPYNVTCHKCPYQASCINGIQSKGNYWGTSDPNSGKVAFTLCPASYCCQSLETCSSYNTCGENREGRLCGDCQKEYVISLFSQNKCVPRAECKKLAVLWTMYLAGAITTCLFVLYSADAWNFISKLLMAKKIRKEVLRQENDDEGNGEYDNKPTIDNEGDQQEPLVHNNKIHPQPETTNNFVGLVKTAFFFYQTASIIRVQASTKTLYNMPSLVGLMTSFFDIKIDVTQSAMTLCPFETPNVVAVEAFRSSVPLVCLLMIFSLMVITSVVTKLQKNYRRQPSLLQVPSGDSDPSLQPPPPPPQQQMGEGASAEEENSFMCRLKGGYVNLMLLGYSSVALFSLRSVYCVNLDGGAGEKTYLFVQASVECHQLWQQLMIAVILMWVAPFPIVLYFGCRLLRSGRISPNQFLLVMTFPPAATCLILYRGGHGRTPIEDWKTTNERARILSVLNEPFRRTSKKKDDSALIWEPVLIGRRLVLVALTTFILSPILRLYPVGLILVMFAIHDHLAKPYSSNHLNLLQFLSTLLLLLLLLLNMFWTFTNDIDVIENTDFFILGGIFIVLEVVFLMLPFIAAFGYLIFRLFKFFWTRFN